MNDFTLVKVAFDQFPGVCNRFNEFTRVKMALNQFTCVCNWFNDFTLVKMALKPLYSCNGLTILHL
jgi:hypothetical protein